MNQTKMIKQLQADLREIEARFLRVGQAMCWLSDEGMKISQIAELASCSPRKVSALMAIAHAVEDGQVPKEWVLELGWSKTTLVLQGKQGRKVTRKEVTEALQMPMAELQRTKSKNPDIVGVTFQLTVSQRDRVENFLSRYSGTRADALMPMLDDLSRTQTRRRLVRVAA